MVKVKVENVDEATKSESPPTLHKKRTMEAISVLKKLNENFSDNKNKKSLLDDTSESKMYLQVSLKKIPPKKMKSMIKVHLPHSLMTDTSEVCLITGDLDKHDKKAEIEPTVLHYKELLKKCGVKGIAEVVPLRQLRTEYKTFESKRQLSGAYDLFINDKKITGCLPKVLGKAFYDNRKFPIQINLETSNLKDQVERAVSEIVFSLSCRGNSCTSEVARLSMDNSEILENIMRCVEILSEKLPGKWANVLGVYIKTARSEAIPIYMSFENSNELKIKAPRHQEKVKAEELSTVRNAEVKVYKDGRLTIKNLPGSDDESDEEDYFDEDDVIAMSNRKAIEEVSDNEAGINPKIKKKKIKVIVNEASDNEVNLEDSTPIADIKPKNKRKKTKVVVNEESDNEVNLEDSTPIADIKPKNKRKKTKVVVNEESDNEVKLEDSIPIADVKPKNKRKKTKELILNTMDDEQDNDVSAIEIDVNPKIKRRNKKVLVQNASNNINEVKVKDSTSTDEAVIKLKNKRKKTEEVVGNTSDNKAKEQSCANEVEVLSKIKRRKIKDSSNEIDEEIIEIKKRKTNKRNNK